MIAPPAVGSLWAGRFELRERREGGPGRITYLALDRAFGVEVELWWILPGVHRDQAADALVAGAGTLRALAHPCVRSLLDCGFDEGTTWASYAVAAPGVQPREKSPMPSPAVAAWARAVAAGLAAAHQLGWFHGRLVPADVVLVQGAARVGGIALWMMAEPVSVAAWSAEQAYLAPEVIAGWRAGASADVWGLAAAVAALAAGGPQVIDQRGPLEQGAPRLAAALAGALVPDPTGRIGLGELVARIDAAVAAGPEAIVPRSRTMAPGLSGPALPLPPRLSTAVPAVAPPPVLAAPPPIMTAPPPLPRTATAVPGLPLAVGPAQAGPGWAPPQAPGAAVAAPPLTPPIDDAFSPAQVTGALQRARTAAPGEFQAVSLKPAAPRPATGQMPAVSAAAPDDEPARPRAFLRPLSELSAVTVEAGAIGYVAPPRGPEPAPPRRRWVPVVGIALGGLGAAAIALVVATQTGTDEPAAPAPAAEAAEPNAAPPPPPRLALSPAEPARGCTDATLAMGDVCVEPFEAPGQGKVPTTGLTARAAADACAARGLRLCTPTEWRAACAGTEAAVADPAACNLGGGGAIVAAGTLDRCKSTLEAHDLLGNVAEWVADGTALGGSALDAGGGRCDGPARTAAAGATFADVGYRCCGDR